MKLDLAFSPCPNDTFIFYALLHGRVDTGDFVFTSRLHDVEELNRMAFDGRHDVTKLSFSAWLALRDRYEILDSGAALGYGCGPLLVARDKNIDLSRARIAIPGIHTTAWLLLRLWNPGARAAEAARFDLIMEGVRSGKYDAGLVIHEGRFLVGRYGLETIIDLGRWWESETGSPIPLGCIAIRKDSPGYEHRVMIEKWIRQSVEYSFAHPAESRPYVKEHSQEMEDEVIDAHIKLYVNDFTLSLGAEGKKAVSILEERARWISAE